jgi:hypothetical protein
LELPHDADRRACGTERRVSVYNEIPSPRSHLRWPRNERRPSHTGRH